MNIKLLKSPRATKKWRVIFPNGKTVDFGGKGYSDYTIHKDPERMKRYLIRHKKREDWSDPYTAGFWSRWLLWSEPSMVRAIKLLKNKFNFNINKVN